MILHRLQTFKKASQNFFRYQHSFIIKSPHVIKDPVSSASGSYVYKIQLLHIFIMPLSHVVGKIFIYFYWFTT